MDEVQRNRLLALFEEVSTPTELSENDSESNEDSADENFINESMHETDTEQDESSNEEDKNEEPEKSSTDRSQFYYGKDGTKWRKEPLPLKVRTRQRNIVTHVPGAVGEARNGISPYQCWVYFFTEILDCIVINTNVFIQKYANKFKDKHDIKETNATEVKALLGLLYLAGTQHGGRKNLKEFYQDDGLRAEIFPATMSERRLRFLLRCLRFDNINTRDERKTVDKLAAVRTMVDIFNQKCKAYYSVGEYVSLDEMLLAFRGRCSFKMYIPLKPNKYGIKVFSMVDARTFYTSHIEIYAGTQPDGPFKLNNSTTAVTERMCTHLFGSGRNITMDRWFTNYSTVKSLLQDHRLTVVGTIRVNKRELPPELTTIRTRDVHSSIFGFSEDMTAVSYIPKKSKNVLLVSSMHLDNKIDESTGDLAKPEIVTFYNMTKGGVDVVDRMITSYNVARNTRRWPMVVFYGLLNVTAINAFIIYKSNNPDGEFSKSRRLFLRELGKDLVRENMMEGANSSYLPRSVREIAGRLTGVITPENIPQPPPNKRGRCKYCTKRKTRYYCKYCKSWLCMEHIIACCRECAEKNN